MWRATCARARSPRLAWPGRGGAKGAGARHVREWSAEIRPLALRGRGYLLPFDFKISTDCELSRLLVPFVPTAEVHLRSGEQVSGTLRLLDPAPGEGE